MFCFVLFCFRSVYGHISISIAISTFILHHCTEDHDILCHAINYSCIARHQAKALLQILLLACFGGLGQQKPRSSKVKTRHQTFLGRVSSFSIRTGDPTYPPPPTNTQPPLRTVRVRGRTQLPSPNPSFLEHQWRSQRSGIRLF